MSASTRKLFGTAFLVFFVALVVGINFLHKERGPSEETTCPACQFQQNSLGTALVVIVLFLPFVLLSLVELPECRFAEPLFRPKNVSRAPPSA
jgi:hypothetical protein